jgi:hypothetical protein
MSILEKIFMIVGQVFKANKARNGGNIGEPRTDFQKFLSYLDSMGYTIEGSEQKDGGVRAIHPQSASLWVYRGLVGIGLVATYQMGHNAVIHSSDYHEFLCQMNGEAGLTVFYAPKDLPILRLRAVYPAPYEKKSFALFMHAFYAEGERVRQHSKSGFFSRMN